MRQGQNIKGVQWVIVGSIIIGLIFIVSGAILTGYAYTEITPPDYDTNYDRYIGSSVTRLLGPFILAFGGLILIASCGILGFQSFGPQYDNLPQEGPIKHQYAED
ncbi:hypothetical protein TYRP_007269 [Tyrophagus putrescentiae]|nr:hypothetical protein TYRP_007269 [Tyrophagus putrescentiae]